LSRRNILIAVAVLAVLALGGLGYYLFQRSQGGDSTAPQQQATTAAPAPGAHPRGTLPDPVFLVLDKAAVLRFSKAGQDITHQMQPLVQQAQASIAAQRAALERDAAQLQQDTSVTGADRDKRIAALDARQQALQAEIQRRQTQLQETMARANGEVAKTLETIIPPLVKERGANIVMDRAAMPQADPAFDITPEVIKRLDAKMTTVRVTLEPAHQ
jgi:outer membrane protein